MKLEQLLTINQLSEVLQIKVPTIYGWVHEDYIPYVKIGRLVRFEEDEVFKWLERKKSKGRIERVPNMNLNF